MAVRYRLGWIWLSGAVLLIGLGLSPGAALASPVAPSPWSVTIYAGVASYARVSDISVGSFKLDDGMVGVAVNRDLLPLGWKIAIAAEAQLTGYVIGHYYATGAVGVGLRFHDFPYSGASIGIYTGPSYALNTPEISDHYYGPSYVMKKFLNYTSIEIALPIPNHERHWDGVFRLYHRSGAWGLYSHNVDEGTMVGFGIRAKF